MAIRKAIVLESDFITNNLILARTYKGSKVKYIRKSVVMMQDKKISETVKKVSERVKRVATKKLSEAQFEDIFYDFEKQPHLEAPIHILKSRCAVCGSHVTYLRESTLLLYLPQVL